MIKVVVVSGIIGVGKTTLLKLLDNKIMNGYVTKVVYEPVQDWKDKGWLEAFYEKPKEKAFVFQMGVYDSAIKNVEKTIRELPENQKTLLFIERYIYDQLLFWKVNLDMGRGTCMDDEIYMSFWRRWKDYIPKPDAYILLYSSETQQRILSRGREAELKASQDDSEGFLLYQMKLFAKHLEFFKEGEGACPPECPKEDAFPCLYLNTSEFPYHKDEKAKLNVYEFIDEWILRTIK